MVKPSSRLSCLHVNAYIVLAFQQISPAQKRRYQAEGLRRTGRVGRGPKQRQRPQPILCMQREGVGGGGYYWGRLDNRKMTQGHVLT